MFIDFRDEADRERKENAKLRGEINELRQLQQFHQRQVREAATAAAVTAATTVQQAGGEGTSPDRMKELKNILNDKAEEVKRRFFNYRRENACADSEQASYHSQDTVRMGN